MTVSDPLMEHLPQLDLMISALESGEFDDLYDLYAELDQTFGTLYGTYADELQYLAADEPQNDVAEKIGERFAEIRPFVAALRDDLSLDDFDSALDTLRELKEEIVTLYSLFGEYKEVSQQGPRYSEIPYTHELLRVGKHYLNGALSIEAVQGRLEVFCQYHDVLETQLSTVVPSPPERAAFEENAEDLEEALSLQLHGIEDLDLALERADNQAISEALDVISEAGEVLVEIYRTLQKADLEPPKISCIRCGADNTTDAKICGECGAVLPQSAAVGPTSTVAFEEDGSNVGPQESEEIARLQQAVDAALHGGDTDSLLECIDHNQKRLARICKQFERMKAPPGDLPREQLELLENAKAVVQEAISEFTAGLDELRQASATLDPIGLENGLERMRAGSDLFVEFQHDFQTAEGMTQK